MGMRYSSFFLSSHRRKILVQLKFRPSTNLSTTNITDLVLSTAELCCDWLKGGKKVGIFVIPSCDRTTVRLKVQGL